MIIAINLIMLKNSLQIAGVWFCNNFLNPSPPKKKWQRNLPSQHLCLNIYPNVNVLQSPAIWNEFSTWSIHSNVDTCTQHVTFFNETWTVKFMHIHNDIEKFLKIGSIHVCCLKWHTCTCICPCLINISSFIDPNP